MRYIELEAGRAGQVLDAWRAEMPLAGVLALLAEADKDKLPLLQAACRDRGIELAGAIFPALVVDQQFVGTGAWLLPFPVMPPVFLLPELNAGEQPALARMVAAVRAGLQELPADSAKPTLFLLFDGMLPNVASLLDDLYLDIANRVDYAGVNAGSETFQPMPCLFDAEQVIGNGVLGLLLSGNAGAVLEHGFSSPERAMSATSTAGNRIAMIDWRPAFAVYQEIIKANYGIELSRANFYQYAVHFPFGILCANGEVVVRIPVAVAEDDSLFCVGEVPENAMLVLLKAPSAGENGCIRRLAGKLHAANGDVKDAPLLTFYCAGRRMHLGEAAASELAELYADSGAATMAGALSLGEIGSTVRRGYPLFHNATLVSMPWRPA